MRFDGRETDDPDSVVTNNTVLRNNGGGIMLYKQDANLYSNTIKDNDGNGIYFESSTFVYLWNNTLSDNDEVDIKLAGSSTENYAIGTTFSTISVDSSSSLIIKSYIDLDVNDASGDNMSDIDIKVMEDDVQKYATSYFGGSDPKTDTYGTIATFLVNSKKYEGSSTAEIIPTYVSARYHDWVETTSFDSSSTIQITVPDLRVQNTRTGTLTYHIQTSLDASVSGDTIRAWAGTYYENLEITEEITLKGNGTSTVINGTYTNNGIEVKEDNVIIKNLTVVSSSTGGDQAGIAVYDSEDVQILNVKFIDNINDLYLEDAQNLIIRNSIFDIDGYNGYGIYATGSSSGLYVIDSEFRNGSSDNSCIYQSASDENGAAQIISNTFDNCYTGWSSGSSNNIFRDNILDDNQYGIMLGGTESYNNMVSDNTFDDNYIGIFIYNSAHDNNLFNNIFDDSEVYDISLSDSDDTVSYNNTFSDINVNDESNMWIKVYIDLTVYDNSSNAFQNADVRVKEDNLALY
ncbi:MAG TPA: hypothetical protein EYO72_02795, partial [Marine Group III euryarchaeote]|nr:hypothetical protein [Marine Group III euryarchaeote]